MILEELPEETRIQMLQRVSYEQMMYSGPIPPASEMAEYNKVILNGADRIMRMAENQSEHRQKLETTVVNANNRDSRLGVWFAGIIGIIGVVGAMVLAYFDKPVMSVILGGGTLATLVGVYLKGTNLDKQDLKDKSKHD